MFFETKTLKNMKELEIKIKLTRKDNGDVTRSIMIPGTEYFSYLEIIGAIQASLFTALNAYEKIETTPEKNETTN